MKVRVGVVVALVAAALAVVAAYGDTRSSASRDATKLTTIRMVQEWPVADGFWIPWIVARSTWSPKAAAPSAR